MTTFGKTKNTIYVDMDGVVADFDAYVLARLGRTFDHTTGPGGDMEMWDFLASVENLYYKLDPTPYARQLLDAVLAIGCEVKMLTAIPRRKSIPSAEQDKKDWMTNHFGDLNIPVLIGPFSRDKWKHAQPGDILIDDRPDNIIDWVEAGGIGILHITDNIQNTLDKLQQFTS